MRKLFYRILAAVPKWNWVLLILLLAITSCSTPLVKTKPEDISDTSSVTIICDATKGNKGLLNYSGPVYVHLGLITDSSISPKHWRFVKFDWGSEQKEALATVVGKNSWSYSIPNIRKFFEVKENEKPLKIAILFRSGNCLDTFCKVLRNEDKSDIFIPITTGQ
jgi:hypothetical protein